MRADAQDHGGGELGQKGNEREEQRNRRLGTHSGPPVVVRTRREARRICALSAERLGDAQAGHVLLEIGVDDADLFPRVGIGPGGEPAEEDGGHDERRQHGEGHQRQRQIHDQQHDGDPREGRQRHHRSDQSGLQERRQRIHVGGHPGHDPAGHFSLVIVQAEPLEMRELPDPELIEHSFAGLPGDDQLAALDEVVHQHHQE